MIVSLADAHIRCGAKAFNLGRLLRAEFSVPLGLVVTDGATSSMPAGPGPFAVRSSALSEDGAQFSFAGQFRTILNVEASDLAEAVRSVAESGSEAYESRLGVGSPRQRVPVIVQHMVDAEVAGVVFTRHPVAGTGHVVIEAARGLGDQVVEGRVTPQRWIPEDSVRPDDPVLSVEQVSRLVELAREIEVLFGAAQDIEWAIVGEQIWILQARPITAVPALITEAECSTGAVSTPHIPTTPVRLPGWEGMSKRQLLGTPASPGTATGSARVIRSLDDFPHLRPGEILICRTTSPAWTPLLARAAAVVTEVGGILSHAAIVAREFGIPAVTEVTSATSRITSGQRLTVDGSKGTITLREQP